MRDQSWQTHAVNLRTCHRYSTRPNFPKHLCRTRQRNRGAGLRYPVQTSNCLKRRSRRRVELLRAMIFNDLTVRDITTGHLRKLHHQHCRQSEVPCYKRTYTMLLRQQVDLLELLFSNARCSYHHRNSACQGCAHMVHNNQWAGKINQHLRPAMCQSIANGILNQDAQRANTHHQANITPRASPGNGRHQLQLCIAHDGWDKCPPDPASRACNGYTKACHLSLALLLPLWTRWNIALNPLKDFL